jgi:hypothetical protein
MSFSLFHSKMGEFTELNFILYLRICFVHTHNTFYILRVQLRQPFYFYNLIFNLSQLSIVIIITIFFSNFFPSFFQVFSKFFPSFFQVFSKFFSSFFLNFYLLTLTPYKTCATCLYRYIYIGTGIDQNSWSSGATSPL